MKAIQKISVYILSFFGILFCKYIFFDFGAEISFTNSVFSVLLFIGLTSVLNHSVNSQIKHKKRELFTVAIVAFVFVLCMAVGRLMERDRGVTFSLAFILAVICWSVISTLILLQVYDLLRKNRQSYGLLNPQNADTSVTDNKQITVTFLGLFIAYLIVFLAVYPGFFAYDAVDEWLQVATREFSTHHPLPHVLLLGGVIQLFYKLTGSYNIGIAVYTLIQVLLYSILFTRFLNSLRKEEKGIRNHLVFCLYYMLFPVISMYVLCSTKDSLFSLFLICFFMMTRKLFLHTKEFFEKRINPVLFVLSALAALLLRYNAIYAFFIFAILVFFVLKNTLRTGNRLRTVTVLMFVVPMICSFLINGLLSRALHATPSEKQEMLTVPITQLARVYCFEKEEMNPDEISLLESYLPPEYLSKYTPRLSDAVKLGFNNPLYKENPSRFYLLWAKVGIKHPLVYLNAWLYTSYGFWYPDAIINVYKGMGRYTYTYDESSYFVYETEEPGYRDSKIPIVDEWYRKMSIELTQQKVPVLSMLFSPGFMFLLYLFILGFMVYLGEYKILCPYLFLGLVWLTYLLGPTYLVRYVVFLWYALPVLLTDFLKLINQGDCVKHENS